MKNWFPGGYIANVSIAWDMFVHVSNVQHHLPSLSFPDHGILGAFFWGGGDVITKQPRYFRAENGEVDIPLSRKF